MGMCLRESDTTRAINLGSYRPQWNWRCNGPILAKLFAAISTRCMFKRQASGVDASDCPLTPKTSHLEAVFSLSSDWLWQVRSS